MLKGIRHFSYSEPIPFSTFHSVKENLFTLQDTVNTNHATPVQPANTQVVRQTFIVKPEAVTPKTVNPEDTSANRIYKQTLPFEAPRTLEDEAYSENFMLGIPEKTVSAKYKFQLQGTDTSAVSNTKTVQEKKDTTITIIPKTESGLEGSRRNMSIDWVPGFLLVSLFIFAWIKILYQKYIVQVITSVLNYQTATRLLRERNILFQNMALGLNFVFAINTGLFLYYLIQYFNPQFNMGQVITVFSLAVSIIIFYNVKTFFCRLLGNIFQIKEEFAEYVHNINLYNKNVGLFLFPIVVSFPYIGIEYKTLLVYTGILIIGGLYILRIIRGVQIILRKGASIFYLILYLCAVEFLPVILLVKFSLTLV